MGTKIECKGHRYSKNIYTDRPLKISIIRAAIGIRVGQKTISNQGSLDLVIAIVRTRLESEENHCYDWLGYGIQTNICMRS